MRLIIINANILNSDGELQLSRITVHNGIVESISVNGAGEAAAADPDTRIIDAGGKLVTPGFIDMHVHLREPGFEHKETIETG
ncbi:MAG: amidohydrolase family protein [Paenibacillus macerans]|nr:amidohydrolase family protein [Paenibacillus macerans]MDU7477986.1 amidohydrolase family protein [Paenibacillus macerans]